MEMSLQEKKINLSVSRRRYAQLSSKKEKGLFLDQFCQTTGLDRKHAIKQLSKRKEFSKKRRGRPRHYTMVSRGLLTEIWHLSDHLCGKLLHAVVGMWIESLKKAKHVDVEAEKQVRAMSASTMDRLLRSVKHRTGVSKHRHSSLTQHRREIPLKIDIWPEGNPKTTGWLEADTVAHCGGSTKGSYIWSLTVTDVFSQWTEIRCVWNIGAHGVCFRISEIVKHLPFPVIMLNTDNGSEFLNQHLIKNFPELCPNALQSRSRPYRKNDNAHIEQKNGHRVRNLFGYARMDQYELLEAMNELAVIKSTFDNLFRPTQRLLLKRREGRKYIKQFESSPKTPAQRILEDVTVEDHYKERIKFMLSSADPITLRLLFDKKVKEFQKLQYLIENPK